MSRSTKQEALTACASPNPPPQLVEAVHGSGHGWTWCKLQLRMDEHDPRIGMSRTPLSFRASYSTVVVAYFCIHAHSTEGNFKSPSDDQLHVVTIRLRIIRH